MFEKDININDIKEIRTRTTVYFGVGAIQKIHDIAKVLKNKGIDKVIVMSGRNAYKATGAWDVVEKALKENGIGYVNYDQVTPNPTTHHVNDAVKLAKDFGAKAVIAIGGGSPTDAGKSVAILLEYPDKTANDIYEFTFTKSSSDCFNQPYSRNGNRNKQICGCNCSGKEFQTGNRIRLYLPDVCNRRSAVDDKIKPETDKIRFN